MSKNKVKVFNTVTNEYETVDVSEKVYKEFMRSEWDIKNNDKAFFKHQIQNTSLTGNLGSSYENFDEYIQSATDVEEEAFSNLLHDALHKAMSELDAKEWRLIRLLFFYDKNERECAYLYGINQKNINKKKCAILSKLNKLLKKYLI